MIYASYTSVWKNTIIVGLYRPQIIWYLLIQNCIWHIFNTDILHMYLTFYTYCVTARFPACRTDLSVSVCVLEGLDQSQCLVHRAPNWEIIHGDLAQCSFRINDKQTSEKQQRPYHLYHHVRYKASKKDVCYHFISICTANNLALNTLLKFYFSELVNCLGI